MSFVTRISNSLVEMYTMQSYLQRRELKNLNAELDLNKEEAPIVLDNEAEPDKAEIEVLDETEEEVEVA